MNIELANPNWRYTRDINEGKHYLNCPKHLLNEWLFHNARQTTHYSKDERIGYVHEIIKKYACRTNKQEAKRIVESFENLTFKEMAEINPNTFRDNQPTPKCILDSIRQTKEYEDRLFKWRYIL
jgi:glutamate synthase domain-containing protein 3